MSKTIVNIDQISDGGVNPETNINEDVLWTLHFNHNGDERILGKIQMLEYLTAGTSPTKNVHSFKKWDLTTTSGSHIRTWVIVYDDKQHIQLTNKDFYELITNGHRNKERKAEEEQDRIRMEETSNASPVEPANPVVFTDAKDVSKNITSPSERSQIDANRENIKKETSNEDFLSSVRKDYYSNPNAKGYEDKHWKMTDTAGFV